MSAWLQLARVTNLPSAASNVLTAFLLAHGGWWGDGRLILLLLVSLFCYAGGTILNDWADVQRDRERQPDRPIAAGRISRSAAGLAAIFLFGIALLASAFLSAPWTSATASLRPFCLTLALVAAIWLYDVPLKTRWFAPFLMGACRACNVLLGASLVNLERVDAVGLFGFPHAIWLVAFAVGLYTSGITFLARRESESEKLLSALWTWERWAALVCFALSLSVFSALFFVVEPIAGPVQGSLLRNYCILIGILGAVVMGRAVWAGWQRTPSAIHTAVVTALRSMMMFDAALCWAASLGSLGPSMLILGLLGLSLALRAVARPT